MTAWYLQISNHFRIYTVLYSTCRKVTRDHSQPSASIPSRIQGSSHRSRSSGLASPHLEAIAPGSWIPWIASDDQHVMREILGLKMGFQSINKYMGFHGISWDFMVYFMGFHGFWHYLTNKHNGWPDSQKKKLLSNASKQSKRQTTVEIIKYN